MKIMVTGGAGYIGSHTCKALAEDGHEVIVYDNLETGHRDFVKWGPLAYGDIKDTHKFRSALREHKPDAIIHFAAYAYVNESVANPGKYYKNNVLGTLSILEAMVAESVHNIVVSGTCAVYGEPESLPIRESMPTRPINPYGRTKLVMERMLEDFQIAHGLNWLSLRYFNAAGSSPEGEIGELHEPETHLIPNVINAALGKIPEIKLFGTDYPTPDGTCIRDYIHVEDLASAHILAAKRLISGGQSGALNLGTGKGSSVQEVIDGVREIAGKDIPVRRMARRAGDPAQLVADPSQAIAALGWEPKRNLHDMLTHAWNFLKDIN